MSARQTFFAFRGRINRRRFFFGNLAVLVVLLIANGAMEHLARTGDGGVMSWLLMIAIGIVLAALVYVSLALGAKRLHDLGHTGWHLVWIGLLLVASELLAGVHLPSAMLLGLVGAVAQLSLYIARGEDGPNAHGLPCIPPRA